MLLAVRLCFSLLLVIALVKLVDSPLDKHQEMPAVSNKMEMQYYTANYSYETSLSGIYDTTCIAYYL